MNDIAVTISSLHNAPPSTGELGSNESYISLADKEAPVNSDLSLCPWSENRTAGNLAGIVKMEETTPLESGKGYKLYAAGIGLLKDGELELVRYGPSK